MTLVVSQYNENRSSIDFYSDSRVSDTSVLTDSAAKLFPLSMKIWDRNSRLRYRGEMVYAFAGSVLVAQSTYAFSNAALQSLRIEDGGMIPHLGQVVEFVGKKMREYINEIGQRRLTVSAVATEALIGGYCSVEKRMRLFKLETVEERGSVTVGMRENRLEHGMTTLMGSSIAIKYVNDLLDSDSEMPIISAMMNCIKHTEIPSVGGDLQSMSVFQNEARVLPVLHKTEKGTVVLKLLNKTIEHDSIGDCNFKHHAVGAF